MRSARATENPILIAGGGPAGSVAALCLRKLGRAATVLERVRFPRYQIGESLLPGTLAILDRLGVKDRIEQAGFPKKRAATFLWGENREPWTFSFATPKTAPWVHDHAYQVNRAELDALLLSAAADAGAEVRHDHDVLEIASDDDRAHVDLTWQNGSGPERATCSYVIDATGRTGITAKKYGLRRHDDYFRNLALWSYFRGGRRLAGELEGNILSAAFDDGWIWMIPQKDDVYSVGVVTGAESSARIRSQGPEAFYAAALAQCPAATDLLKDAEQFESVRVTLDWSYDAARFSQGRTFLCGDSACFVDPLFSQGVHLAVYSATQAAAAIDYLLDHPEDSVAVRSWYDRTYREAYQRYYRFVAGFYSAYPGDSPFWNNRRIQQEDARFADAGRLSAGAATLAKLWAHGEKKLEEGFDASQLALRRVAWASERARQFRSMETVRWTTGEVRLAATFSVHPTTFRLERQQCLDDDASLPLPRIAMGEEQRRLFDSLRTEPLSYRALLSQLRKTAPSAPAVQILDRLFEAGALQGFDSAGRAVAIEFAPRFGGVGGEDDLS